MDSEECGFEKMESGINAIAMDFVRFGCLYRDGGKVNGEQVVSKEWIEQSLAFNNKDLDYYSDNWGKQIYAHGGFYGYGWYVFKPNADSDLPSDFFGIGNKGQIVYISPSSNLVAVRFGEQNIISLWKWIEAFQSISRMLMKEK